MTSQPIDSPASGAASLCTGASGGSGPARLTSASAPAFVWEVGPVPGAEGRELRRRQAAAIKELIGWVRQAEAASTRAG